MTGFQADLEKVPNTSIRQEDQDRSQPPCFTPRSRTLRDKLGLYNIVVLSLGTVAILLAVAFLAFIWTVANNITTGGDFPVLWRLIVEARWASQVVTLCSIVIRVAAAAQLCVFAAVVAALILERVGASTEDLPLLSMIRCANAGPNALIWNVAHTVGSRSQTGYSALIVVTIANALVMQFTSTMLLTDLVPTNIVLNTVTQEIYFGMTSLDGVEGSELSVVNPYIGSDIWRTGTQSYPRFAEFKGSTATKGPNFTDTGILYRGFLPFQNENHRNALRDYTGPMTVVDVRTLCVKPSLSNMTFEVIGNGDNNLSYITGNLDVKNTHPDLSTIGTFPDDPKGAYEYFNCTTPMLDYTEHAIGWNASICILEKSYGRLLNPISPEDVATGIGYTGRTTASLFFNTSRFDGPYDEGTVLLESQESSIDSWAKFGNKAMTFELSFCFTNPLPRDYEISARSTVDVDKDITYSVMPGKVANTWIYDTTQVQKMLGADGAELSPEQRRLLTIIPPTNWNASRMKTLYNTKEYPYIFDILELAGAGEDKKGTTYHLSPNGPRPESMHRSHAALMQQILTHSANPALAMQALWTILLEISYYDLLPLNNVKSNATYGLSQQVLIPVRWTCFAAVMAILGLHFILVSTALALFLTRTEMSLLGNAWQAVSQVMSEDTADAVHHGAMATDGEVKDSFKQSGVSDGRIRIAKCEQSGRVEARAVVARR